MSIKHKILSAGLTSVFATLPLLAEAQMNVTVGHKPGLCILSIPAGVVPGTENPMKLKFTHRVSDGTTQWALLVNGWPKAQEADPNYDFPVVLTFDTGETVSSNSGGYSSGFDDKLWGTWNAGADAETLLSLLEKASTVQIAADSMDFGNIDLQGEGFIYRMIDSCATKKRANGE